MNKVNCFLILFFLSCSLSFSQKPDIKSFVYNYDKSSNVLRKIPIYNISPSSDSSEKEYSTDRQFRNRHLYIKSTTGSTVAKIDTKDIKDTDVCIFTIYSASGELMYRKNIENSSSEYQFDDLNKGSYLFTLYINDIKEVRKVLVR